MLLVALLARQGQAFLVSPSVFRATFPFHRSRSKFSVSNNPASSTPEAPVVTAATFFCTPSSFRAAFALEGLDEELEAIRQQVVLPLATPRALLDSLGGVAPVRGLLLVGPTGTGKSSLAIRLAEILSPESPTVLTGLESADDIAAVLSAPPRSSQPLSTPGSTATALVQLPQTPPAIDRLVVGRTASNVLARTGGVGGVYEPFEGTKAVVRSGLAVPPVPGYSWLRNDAAPIVKPQLPVPLTPPIDYRQQQAPRKDNTQQRDAAAASTRTAALQPQEQQASGVQKSTEPGAPTRLRVVIAELDFQSSAENQRSLQAHLRAAMDCTAPYQSEGSNNEGLLVISVARSSSSVLDPSLLAQFNVQVQLPLLDQPSPHHRIRRAAILARHCAPLRRAGRLAVAGLSRVPSNTHGGEFAADDKVYSEWLLQLADVCGPTLSSGAELAGIVHAASRRAWARAHAQAVAAAAATTSDGVLVWGEVGQAGTALGDAAVYNEDFEGAVAGAIQRKRGNGGLIKESRPPRATETSVAPTMAPLATPAAAPVTPPAMSLGTTPAAGASAATAATAPSPSALSSETPTPRLAASTPEKEADTARVAVEAALADVKARMAATGWKHWNEESIRAGVEGKKQAAIKSRTTEAEAAAAAAMVPPPQGAPPDPDGALSFAEVVERMRQEERSEARAKKSPNEGMF